jgi:hypothetical protein
VRSDWFYDKLSSLLIARSCGETCSEFVIAWMSEHIMNQIKTSP